jgi:amino acid transporter
MRKEHRPLYVKIKDIDIYTGMREGQVDLISGPQVTPEQRRESIIEMQDEQKKKGAVGWTKAVVRSVF